MSQITSALASAVRFPLGRRAGALGPRPARRLELYEFEACPFCRKVREAVTMLDLEVLIRPTPRGGTRFRPEAIARGGRAQFPLLFDPNAPDAGAAPIYESAAIIAYLYARYGAGAPPLALRLGPLGTATSSLASFLRSGHGRAARASRAPTEPLALWSSEASPAARRVREALCELELPYVLHSAAPGGARAERAVPSLADPNTGAALAEVGAILAYLTATYAQ